MKKWFVILALQLPCLLSMAACESACRKVPPKTIQPDSLVYSMLGKTMTDVLFQPTSVKCYTIAGKSKVEPTDYQIEPHWVRDSLIGDLSAELIGVLQYVVIANPDNYKTDSVQIRSPYCPKLLFEFQKKKNVVHVVLSPMDRTWTIVYDDKRQVHFNYHNYDLMDRFCEIFLPTQNTEEQQ